MEFCIVLKGMVLFLLCLQWKKVGSVQTVRTCYFMDRLDSSFLTILIILNSQSIHNGQSQK